MAIPVLQADWQTAKVGTNLTSGTVNKPTSLAEGDLYLIIAGTDGKPDPYSWDGDLNLIASIETLQGSYCKGEVYGKDAGASEASTRTVSWPDAQEAVLAALRITGAHATYATAIHASVTLQSSGSSSTPTSPGLTTTADDCLILRLLVHDTTVDFADDTDRSPASSTLVFSRRSSTLGSYGPCGVHLATESKATAGSVSETTWGTGESEQYISVTIAIAPGEAAPSVTMIAAPGSYSIAGQDADFRYFKIAAAPGSYAVSGQDAITAKGVRFAVDPGAYEVTGQDIQTLYGRVFTVDPGSYSVTGGDAFGYLGRISVVDSGSYTVTGFDAAFQFGYVMFAEVGGYTLSGVDAAFTPPDWQHLPINPSETWSAESDTDNTWNDTTPGGSETWQ